MSICECCITPMQSILQQLVGQTVVAITTVADEPPSPLFVNVTIVSAQDFLLTVTQDGQTYTVSIFDVVSVTFPADIPIILPPPSDNEASGICHCKEQPERVLFTSLLGQTVIITASNGFSTPVPATIVGVGQGVALISLFIPPETNLLAVASLCRVSNVRLP